MLESRRVGGVWTMRICAFPGHLKSELGHLGHSVKTTLYGEGEIRKDDSCDPTYGQLRVFLPVLLVDLY